MDDGVGVVRVAMLLAYGPLLAITVLWLAAVVLLALGRPALFSWLLRRTAVPQSEPPGYH